MPYLVSTILPSQNLSKASSFRRPGISFFKRSMVCTGLRYNETPSFISLISNSALAARRRSRVVWMLLMFISVWMNLRPNLFATVAVTPLPPKKSATTIPLLLLALMIRSRRASGFWVAYPTGSSLSAGCNIDIRQTSSIVFSSVSIYIMFPLSSLALTSFWVSLFQTRLICLMLFSLLSFIGV